MEEDVVKCPKCGSVSLSVNKKGFSVGKAITGVMLLPGGVLWGLHGRNKLLITCLKCGHKFKPGEKPSTFKVMSDTFKEEMEKSKSDPNAGKWDSNATLGLIAVLVVIVVIIFFIVKGCS